MSYNWHPYDQWGRPGPMRRGPRPYPHPHPHPHPPPPPEYRRYPPQPPKYIDVPYHRPHPYAQPFDPRPPPPIAQYPVPDLQGIPHADAQHRSGLSLREENRQRRERLQNNYTDFENFVDAIFIDAEISAQKIKLSWKPASGYLRNIHYMIRCVDKDNHRWNWDQPWTQTERELKTTQGQTYTVTVEAREYDGRVRARAIKEYRAVFSMEEQDTMYDKAVHMVGTNMHRFDILYRCKPKAYWDDIHHSRGDTMEKYIKDNNGQPANLINGIIKGLFFSARLLPDGSLPPQSPFGNVRMMVKAEVLLNREDNNFYFADFYCNYVTHYVTIVVCRKNSETDRYCQLNIKRLPEDNPFLSIKEVIDPHFRETYYHFFVNRGVWVELYYTEDIPLNWGRFASIVATGAGTSRIGGLPNNKQCDQCNLYPQVPEEGENGEIFAEENILDLTMGQDRLNSTFVTVVSQHNKKFGNDWEDLVEVTCGLIDSVCSAEEDNVPLDDPQSHSDHIITSALTRMTNELKECKDETVHRAAKLLTDFFEAFKQDRTSIMQAMTTISESISVAEKKKNSTQHCSPGTSKVLPVDSNLMLSRK